MRTGSYVSLSRSKLGPEPEKPAHGLRGVDRVGSKYVATCWCGWHGGKRRMPSIAREALAAHIAERVAS